MHKPVTLRARTVAVVALPLVAIGAFSCQGPRDFSPQADLETSVHALTTRPPEIGFETKPAYIANNVIALSFDDGPDSDGSTASVLDTLKAKGVKATFFINTNNYCVIPDGGTCSALVKRIVNEGHVLGSHTVHHLHLPDLSTTDIESEITGVQTAVNNSGVLGSSYPKLTLLRDPFGEPHQTEGPGDAGFDKVAPIVAKYAVHVGWAIDPTDYDCITGTASQNRQCVLDHVLNTIKTPGATGAAYGPILMHSVQPQTAAALSELIDTIKSRGFVFKTVEELVVAKYGKSSNQIVYGTCTAESNATFCSRLGKNCGSVTANDNCGTSRTVTSCGTCTSPQTCGGGGTANVCGTPAVCNEQPFGGTARAVPGTIQAEDFDTGGEGCAYSDTTTANQGNAYRTSEAVDIQATTDTGGGFNIGFVQAGEYLNYTVNVTTAGNYKLELRVSSTATGKTVDVFAGSTLIANDLAVPNTGNFQTFATVSVPSVSLGAGTQVLKVVFNQASQNLNWIKLSALASCTPETDAAFCARLGKTCGSVTANDNCGTSRTVTSCGACTAPATCGGGGTPNVCGSCTAETDTAFCSRLGKNCGSVSGTDNCGTSRAVSSCGTCTAPATCSASNVCTSSLSITTLVVNDTSAGNDGVANNTQWSVQATFGGGSGQQAFGDRTYTIATLTGSASSLAGKPWIRTAADSKTYAATSPPLATAFFNASFVNLAVDSRHATTFLTNAGFASRGFSITVMEGTTARTYNVWRKAITPGSTVTLPTVNAATAPCYFVIAE